MKHKFSIYFVCLIGFLTILQSCKKEYESIQITDDRKIEEYIRKNGLTMAKDPSGFYYQIITQGTGSPLKNSDSVFFALNYKSLSGKLFTETGVNSNGANYVGYLSNKYSSTYPTNVYQIMMNKMNRGGKFKVILPSYLAFGKNGFNNIPGNEVLISEVSIYSELTQAAIDEARIQKFLTDKGLTALRNQDGVYFIVTQPGSTGLVSTANSSINAKYTGRLLDGTVFDKSIGDDVFGANLAGGVIAGWTSGLQGYQAGTKIRLIIPSNLGYGISGKDPIPPNAVLDFDIELVTVTN